jgi:2-phospho-L-lactate guanylyltransferase
VTLTVVVPVNRLDRAKGRLEGVLAADERRDLALATLETVVEAVARAGLRASILTADGLVSERFAARATILPESDGARGLNGQLENAIRGLEEVLILHADLPLVSEDDIGGIAAAATPAPSVELSRSRDGGTNAMLLRPPGLFALAYGPGSWQKHHDAAVAAGCAVERFDSPGLELDLDTAADLELFLRREGWEQTHAGAALARTAFGRGVAEVRERRRR